MEKFVITAWKNGDINHNNVKEFQTYNPDEAVGIQSTYKFFGYNVVCIKEDVETPFDYQGEAQ